MKKNEFRQKMLEIHKNDADIYKIKKKHNDLGSNSKISLITYNNNDELLIIKETEDGNPIKVIKTNKEDLDLSNDTKLTTESLNMNSNSFTTKQLEKILPTVDTIIKDTDDKLYGISFGNIKQIGVSDSIDESVSCKDLNRWVENSFNYYVVDKEFSDTAICYNKFHYHDYHFNHKLRKNKLQVTDDFGDTELLILSKEKMHIMQHGTEEEKYSIIFDRYSLNKNTRYRLLSTAQIVEYEGYITYFDGLNTRHGELIGTMDNGDKKFYVYHPSNIVTGINATASNTYTYEFELICGPDNSLKNFKFLQKLDYCRVIEGNSFKNYYRSPVTKVATGVYKYIGSTSSNVAPNTTLTSTSNTASSGTNPGVHRGYGELKSGAETGAATYHIYDSRYCTGINATSSNTKTTPYILTVNAYNKVTTNCTATTVLDYGRVIEGTGGNAKFVNYLRNPINRGLSYSVRGRSLSVTHYVSGTYTYSTDYVRYRTVWDDENRSIGKASYDTDVYWSAMYVTCDKYNSVKSTSLHDVEIDGSWSGGWNENEDRWYSASDYVISRTPYHCL